MAASPVARRQSGVALITVMFIVVLMSTLAVYLWDDQYLSLRRAENQRDSEEAYQLVAGAEQWASKILERDMRDNATDHLKEAWFALLPEIPVERGKLSIRVDDLQGLFNINNLAAGRDKVWYPAFQRLLRSLGLDEGLADAVVDWIDNNDDQTGSGGAEDAYYLGLSPSYRAANAMFADVGELRWVKGFDARVLNVLGPYITALPGKDIRINANTAPAQVLRILGRDIISESAAATLVDARGESGYRTVQDILKNASLAGQGDTAEPLISVASRYFLISSRAQYGRLAFLMQSTIQRDPQRQRIVILHRARVFT